MNTVRVLPLLDKDENYFYFPNNKKLPTELVNHVLDNSPYKFNAWPSLYLQNCCNEETMYVNMIRSIINYFDCGGDQYYRDWIKNKKEGDLTTYSEYVKNQNEIEKSKQILLKAGFNATKG
jgi:hypothetical protein